MQKVGPNGDGKSALGDPFYVRSRKKKKKFFLLFLQ